MSLSITPLDKNDIDVVLDLATLLNPNIPKDLMKKRQLEAFEFDNYICFGCYENEAIVGMIGGWITSRLYSGKQLELDHVIINPNIQSKGLGTKFLVLVEQWAQDNGCQTIELNTYVENKRSHKFYMNKGFDILGFHMLKKLTQ